VASIEVSSLARFCKEARLARHPVGKERRQILK